MKAIDLGFEAPEYGAVAPPAEPEKVKMYPTLYINDCPPELMGLEDGEAVIKFKVASRVESERRGKEDCSLELDIISITPKNMPKPMGDESQEDGGRAIDDYFKEEE